MNPALAWAIETLADAGIENPRFEAQLLLAHVLGLSRAAVAARLYQLSDDIQEREFRRLVRERAKRVPLAYLRGEQEFYGLPFLVTPAVLIPRPETEMLVDFAREALPESTSCVPARPAGRSSSAESDPDGFPVVVDVGTGSGCIAVAILAHCPTARAIALDLSAEALAVAGNNAARNNVTERIRFVRASCLEGVAERPDLIVSNPPYISTAEIPTLQAEVREYEPRLALDGGADGLEVHRRLAAGAFRALRPGGWLAVEVAQGQAQAVAALLQAAGLVSIQKRRDLAGIERMVCGQRKSVVGSRNSE